MIIPYQSAEYYESLLMREDVQFSIALLNMIGDEPHWPSRLRMKDYRAEFSEKSMAEIAFHLNCCLKAGLIEADIKPSPSIRSSDNENETAIDVFTRGLTPAGDTYLRDCESPTSPVVKMARNKLIEKGLEITTERLVIAVASVAAKMLESL